MKKMLLLINPISGRGGFRGSLAAVLETFSASDYLPTVFFTNSIGNATQIVKEHAKDYDIVVCQGGDGTLSEVISGLTQIPDAPPLGYIPMGTTNDVASSLELPISKPVRAAERIVNGSPMPFDVGSFGDSAYFAYIAAFGAFTDVSYETPQNIKHTLGHMAYMLEGMRSLTRLSPVVATVVYDDGIITDEFVFGGVTNSTSIAGIFKLNRDVVELGDGLFEVILIKNPQSLADMNDIVGGILSQNIIVLHSSAVRFRFDTPAAWTRDGENGGEFRDLKLVNHHAAIRFII